MKEGLVMCGCNGNVDPLAPLAQKCSFHNPMRLLFPFSVSYTMSQCFKNLNLTKFVVCEYVNPFPIFSSITSSTIFDMAELPKTMKAWRFTRSGKLKEVLKLKTDAPLPSIPKAGEVMIRVSYVAINPADYKLIEMWIPFRYPATPSIDFVGEIVQIGNTTSNPPTDVRIGMTVAGSVPTSLILRGVGVLAEYIVLPAHAVVEKPHDLQETVAAGLLGVAGQTSARVVQSAVLQEGDRVLLNGASGGVGTVLTQVLCGMGVRVTGICSARNEALVRRLGAEEVRRFILSGVV
jgi:NADPH:quinone reductase-like Zn-dependent oxidoreductase